MAASMRLKDVFEFVRRIKASSGTRVEGTTSSTNTVPLLPSSIRKTAFSNYHNYTTGRKGLQLIAASTGSPSPKESAVMMDDEKDGKKFTPPSPQFIFRRWGAWLIGFFTAVVLPFWRTRLEHVQKIEGEAERVVEEIDKVAKVVEKVAVVAEKVSEELAEVLPENSKLQKTALVVENLSKVAEADAATAENIIQKVEVLKQDFQELENAALPVITKNPSEEFKHKN